MNRKIDVDHPYDFENLAPLQQEVLIHWVKFNLGRSERYYKKASSYTLKHYFEQSPEGFYVTNGQFKGAMLAADYTVKNTAEKNWYFKVSPFFVERLEKHLKVQ